VKDYLFDNDMLDDSLLPSPNQLKYKILIKNKKILKQTNTNMSSSTNNYNNIESKINQSLINANTQTYSSLNNSTNTMPNKLFSYRSSISNKFLNSSEINNDYSTALYSINNTNDETTEINENIYFNATQTDLVSTNSSMINRIKTRLTAAADPIFKRNKTNVANFIHKSKSLTDHAFNKLNNNSNKIKSVTVNTNTNEQQVQVIDPIKQISQQQQQQQSLNTTNLKTTIDFNSIDQNHLNRIKKRLILLFIILDKNK